MSVPPNVTVGSVAVTAGTRAVPPPLDGPVEPVGVPVAAGGREAPVVAGGLVVVAPGEAPEPEVSGAPGAVPESLGDGGCAVSVDERDVPDVTEPDVPEVAVEAPVVGLIPRS